MSSHLNSLSSMAFSGEWGKDSTYLQKGHRVTGPVKEGKTLRRESVHAELSEWQLPQWRELLPPGVLLHIQASTLPGPNSPGLTPSPPPFC